MDVQDFVTACVKVEWAICYLGRRYIKPQAKKSMWKLAVNAFEELVGDGEEWENFTALVISCVDNPPKERGEKLDKAWDIYETARLELVNKHKFKLPTDSDSSPP